MREQLIRQIAQRAMEYNWEREAEFLETRGHCPVGFGKQVGQAITLFATPPPLGGMLQSRREYAEQREDDRLHARRLCELRVWIAKLNILNREHQQ